MYSISNKQRDEVLALLRAFVETNEDKSLQSVNRRRRAVLLMRNIEKRKPYDKKSTKWA